MGTTPVSSHHILSPPATMKTSLLVCLALVLLPPTSPLPSCGLMGCCNCSRTEAGVCKPNLATCIFDGVCSCSSTALGCFGVCSPPPPPPTEPSYWPGPGPPSPTP